jgi:hypothetical protein
MTLTGRDVLSLPKRGGYRGLVLDLGGMTVTAALRLLFAQLAPSVPVRVEETTETLPTGYLGRAVGPDPRAGLDRPGRRGRGGWSAPTGMG